MIASHALHAVAWTAVHTLPPRPAFRLVKRAAALLPALDPVRAEVAYAALRGGTCLTRSMTIAARTPGARLVIGGKRDPSFRAHAWVELGEKVLGTRYEGLRIGTLVS